MLSAIFRTLAQSRVAARLLFGLAFPPLPAGYHYFDVTSLVLARAARRRIPRGARVLDMGTGSVALLGLLAWRAGCDVAASELDGTIAAQAEASLAANRAAFPILRGAYFAGHPGELDFVLFNPPYVPTETGLARGLPLGARSQWDGGPRGTRAIAGLLELLASRPDRPRVLLGVNRRHVPRPAVEALLRAHGAVELEAVESSRLGVDVYVFSTRKSPIASASSPQA